MNAVLRATIPPSAAMLIPFLLEACIFSASRKEWTPEPWPEGGFELQASNGTTTYTGNLYIAPDGSMTFSTTAGTCAERTPAEVEEDRVRNQRTFSCSGATYLIKPRGRMVQGHARMPVIRTVRGERVCVQRGERGTCLRYDYLERTINTVENVSLRVVRTG
jgi:hypothetical protein